MYRQAVLPGYWHGHRRVPAYRYRVHDDAFLWLGLTVFGLTIRHVLSHEQRLRFEEARSRSGAVTPVREGFTEGGQCCREFQQEIRIGGRTERAWGTACLQAEGS